jgi:hypothetical protein
MREQQQQQHTCCKRIAGQHLCIQVRPVKVRPHLCWALCSCRDRGQSHSKAVCLTLRVVFATTRAVLALQVYSVYTAAQVGGWFTAAQCLAVLCGQTDCRNMFLARVMMGSIMCNICGHTRTSWSLCYAGAMLQPMTLEAAAALHLAP